MKTGAAPSSRTLVIAPIGELDLATAPQLERELLNAEANGVQHLVVDLSGVEFIDSTGLHALLRAEERAAADGRRLSLRPGPNPVQRVFRLLRVESRLSFEPDAIAAAYDVIPVVLDRTGE